MSRGLPQLAPSATLSRIVEAVGEAAALKLVQARGGTDVYLPHRVGPRCSLARVIGQPAARQLVEAFGSGRTLIVPTGRGLAHGRRIDRQRVMALKQQQRSIDEIALALGCTARQVWSIVAAESAPREERQAKLL